MLVNANEVKSKSRATIIKKTGRITKRDSNDETNPIDSPLEEDAGITALAR